MTLSLDEATAILTPDARWVAEKFAAYGYTDILDTRVVVTEEADMGDRRMAFTTYPDGNTVALAPRLAEQREATRRAILAHEFGHVVDFHRGGRDRPAHARELRADEYAERATGRDITYDGPNQLQTFCGQGARPRPMSLDKNR
jgi:hypothetical protein